MVVQKNRAGACLAYTIEEFLNLSKHADKMPPYIKFITFKS